MDAMDPRDGSTGSAGNAGNLEKTLNGRSRCRTEPVITFSVSVISVTSVFKFFLCDLLSKRSWW
jgi:hypothetical protein